jgi:uncharacterized protein YdeI (YjbR/CyaY-like superfamily)
MTGKESAGKAPKASGTDMREMKGGLPISAFRGDREWTDWLEKNHGRSAGVWIRFAKKASGIASVTYEEAVDSAICYGWIDGQKVSGDGSSWLQRFTPRGPRSIWSKINRERAARLFQVEEGERDALFRQNNLVGQV